jgi:hypothetical protein
MKSEKNKKKWKPLKILLVGDSKVGYIIFKKEKQHF